MLETIREFAAETLSDAERSSVAEAHMSYFVEALSQLGWGVRDRDPAAWAFLRAEQANIVAALHRALDDGAADAAQKILNGAWFYWVTAGLAADGDAWAAAVAALPSQLSVQYAIAVALAGEFPRFRGDPERALPYKLRALELLEALGADDPQAERWAAADHTDVADIYAQLDDLETAAEHAERGLEIRRSIGTPSGIAHALGSVGQVAALRGETDEAVAAFVESVKLYDAAGERFEASLSLCNLGNVLRRSGDLVGARAALDDASARALESRDRTDLAVVHNAFGLLAASEGDAALAAELLSCAAAEFDTLGLAVDEKVEAADALDTCRTLLGPEAYEAACNAGLSAAFAELAAID